MAQHTYARRAPTRRRTRAFKQPEPHVALAFATWFYDHAAVLIRRLAVLGVMAFVASIIGTALYVHAVFATNRDVLLLTYLLAIGLGLSYVAVKRPLVWIFGWRNDE